MRLKEIRERLGYSRKQACDYIGCSRTVYTRYENGTRQPSLPTLVRIADVFNVSIDFLLGREGIDQATLTEREKDYLTVFRTADPRAQEDAYNLMAAHQIIPEGESDR